MARIPEMRKIITALVAMALAVSIIWIQIELIDIDMRLDELVADTINSITISFADDQPYLPAETLPLKISQTVGRSTSMVIASVAQKYEEWLVEQLKMNAGVRSFYRTLNLDGTGDDVEYHVNLSDRIGRNDWDALFALQKDLKDYLDVLNFVGPPVTIHDLDIIDLPATR